MPAQQLTTRPKITEKIKSRIKPAGGFAPILHVLYRIGLPMAVFVLVRLDIGFWLPLLIILLSKWRIFAVRPRFWPANIRANAVDLMVGVSIVVFMFEAGEMGYQAFWAAAYCFWLLFIKPSSSILYVSVQAAIGQLCGLMALFVLAGKTLDGSLANLGWTTVPIGMMVLIAGLVCYLAARHFFDSFNEPYAKMLAYIWGYFAAATTWLLGHMLVLYPDQDGVLAHPVLLLSAIGYTLAAVYYLEHFERLSVLIKRELLFLCGLIVFVLLASLFYEGAHLIV
jgi:hypothetical protein